MNINAFIPISVFKVKYELGSGRPVSELDKLIMVAIQTTKHPTLDNLAEMFHLSPRIIVEVAVTLARSNWITVNPENGKFVVTDYGKREFNSGNQPKFMKLLTNETTIIKENVLGQISLYDNVFTTRCNDRKYLMKEYVDSRTMTVEEARTVIRPKSDEWIRFIDTPRLVSRSVHTLRVEVDLDEKKVNFLPSAWKNMLEPVLLEKVSILNSIK